MPTASPDFQTNANPFKNPFLEMNGSGGTEVKMPESEFDIHEENKKYYAQKIAELIRFKRFMKMLFGRDVNFPFNVNFREGNRHDANDKAPVVFMGKKITKVEVAAYIDEKGKEAKEIVSHVGHLQIKTRQIEHENQKTLLVSASNFKNNHNIKDLDEVAARFAILEMVEAACCMVKELEACGVPEVNFGRTTDPVKRCILKAVCKVYEMPCPNEIVDENDLPQNVFETDTTARNILGYALQYSKNIHTPVVPAQTAGTTNHYRLEAA